MVIVEENQSIWKTILQKIFGKYENENGECFAIMEMTEEEAEEFDAFLEQVQDSEFWKSLDYKQQTQYLSNVSSLFDEYKRNKI
jgi:hypothetical protein